MNLYTGKKAIVYNSDISGLGGGDREALAFAKMLTSYGFEAKVLTNTEMYPSSELISDAFGDEFQGVDMMYVCEKEMKEFLEELGPDLFFNQSYMSYFPNIAPLGIYRQMFPVERLWTENSPNVVEAINTYSLILNNSSYTKKYTDTRWDYPAEKSRILLPPLAAASIHKAEQLLENHPKKKKTFVSIGRITSHKNQKLLIEAFLKAREKFSELADWEMRLIGNRVGDPVSVQYYKDCRDLIDGSGGCIHIETNAPYIRIEEALTEAFCYVHGTGAFHLPGEEPQACEHFGLSIAEGMAHGCIPLVYARGGIFDILDIEDGGVPYITFDGLVEGFAEIANRWERKSIRDVQKKMMRSVMKIRYDRCAENLLEIINQEMQ